MTAIDRIRRIWVAGAVIPLMILIPQGASATYPGNNGLIVYQAETADGHQLFTMKPDGTDVRQITHTVQRASADIPGASLADWSPDGRTIVFVENDCQITLIDPDGSDLREVPTEPGHHAGVDICEGDPSFTPDGLSVVYGRYDGASEDTWRVNLDGTGRQLVTDACGIDPNVSPDGRRLSCRASDTSSTLMVVNMDGTGAMLLSPPSAISFKNDWAPDGSAVVFSDEFREAAAGIANIATIAPDGTGLRSVALARS